MGRYQLITLGLAIAVTACLIGTGVAIAERSVIGVISCLVVATLFMGGGFMYKRKQQR